jgi:hypothetical protein
VKLFCQFGKLSQLLVKKIPKGGPTPCSDIILRKYHITLISQSLLYITEYNMHPDSQYILLAISLALGLGLISSDVLFAATDSCFRYFGATLSPFQIEICHYCHFMLHVFALNI